MRLEKTNPILHIAAWAIWLAVVLLPLIVSAQKSDERNATPMDNGQVVNENVVNKNDASEIRMNTLEKKLDLQSERISELEDALTASLEKEKDGENHTQALEARMDSLQTELELQSLLMTDVPEKKIGIWGFFDTTFYKAWYDQENSVLKSQNLPYSTFMMSHVNIYFSSQMTDTLSALVEAGLSFTPLGYETNIPIDANVYNDETGDWESYPDLVDSSEYERVDTTVPGGLTSNTVRYGSVSIVRAHLDWAPRDWFKIRVGQFLTPYGIWNVEHASTVLIGVYYPNLMHWELVPTSQLGLAVMGTLFPNDSLQLNYQLTLSNGRGPTSTVMDLDENKGVGVRFQAILETGNLRIVAGSYGYYGKYTEAERRAQVYLNSDLTRNYDSGSPLGGRIIYLNKYKEYIITGDLSVEFAGFKLFGEFVHRKVDYLVHPVMHEDAQFVQTGDIVDNRYAANHYSQSVYGILAYTLPLHHLEPLKISPYIGADWLAPDDPLEWFEQKTFRFGVNLQPSPFVVLKAEGIIDYFHDVLGGRMNSVAAQLAVTF